MTVPPSLQSGAPQQVVQAWYQPPTRPGIPLRAPLLTPPTRPDFVRHPLGVLTPEGTKTVDQYSQIAAPAAPSPSQVAGGSIGATTYFAKVTLISPSGETTVSSEASLAVSASNLLKIASPAAAGNATGFNVYAATSSGAETLQNASPIVLGTPWTEPVGGLIAGASAPAANTTGWDVFNIFVPDVIAAAAYITGTIDSGFDDDLRVQAQIATGLGFGQSGAPPVAFSIDTWLSAGYDLGIFVPWTINFVQMRYLRGRIDYAPVQGQVAYIQDFVITIDTAPKTEQGGSFAVGIGGSVLIFPTPFHLAPDMPAPNVLSPTGAGYYASATSLSATQATITIFDHTGSSVAGTVSWSATGE